MKKLIKRALAVGVSVLGISAALLTPAQASSVPILYVGSEAHQCIDFYNDGSYQAIICADILTGSTSSGYYAKGQAEAYCQNESGKVVNCDQIYLDSYMYDSANVGSPGTDDTYQCVDDATGYPNCPGNGDREYQPLDQLNYSSSQYNLNNCASNTSADNQVWTVVFSGSQIELPDGNWGNLGEGGTQPNDGQNQTSGHYFICP
jgi:hypothetical protein